jgi:MYXO-CTERM domain-containing protein
MRPILTTLALAAFLIAAAGSVQANPFSISIDTSSISGSSGYIFMQFNQLGVDPGTVTLTIDNLTTDGSLSGSPSTGGSTSGVLSSAVTFVDDPGLNYYLHAFNFGSTLAFSGSFLPNGSAETPSFAISLIDDTFTQALLTDDESGAVATVVLNEDGTLTPTTFTYNGSYSPAQVVVPEPAQAAVFVWGALGLAALAAARRRRRDTLREADPVRTN